MPLELIQDATDLNKHNQLHLVIHINTLAPIIHERKLYLKDFISSAQIQYREWSSYPGNEEHIQKLHLLELRFFQYKNKNPFHI